MSLLLRICMFAGIVLVFLSVVSGMGAKVKPWYTQYLMTAGLVSLGLWVVGGLVVGMVAKDPADEIKAQLKQQEDQAARPDDKAS